MSAISSTAGLGASDVLSPTIVEVSWCYEAEHSGLSSRKTTDLLRVVEERNFRIGRHFDLIAEAVALRGRIENLV